MAGRKKDAPVLPVAQSTLWADALPIPPALPMHGAPDHECVGSVHSARDERTGAMHGACEANRRWRHAMTVDVLMIGAAN